MSPPGTVAVLQAALAAEHAVVWGYAVVGARVDAPLRDEVRRADDTHRRRRDEAAALVRDRGGAPVTTAAGYALPFGVDTADAALRLAAHLEEGAAAAWRYAVGGTDEPTVRRAAAAALTDAAVRATRWRAVRTPAAASVPFPGGSG